jgi:hypothetical protein
MKRIIPALLLAVGLMLGSLATSASATDPVKALERRVDRLETQVTRLQKQVKILNYDVFRCELYDTNSPTTWPDGSISYALSYDSSCI